MSYTVLARKWRPKNFSELVGQAHVMQALSNALDSNRLHHAYLFTGTRGVGKTTIARIFSKALNCQEGISSTPCGVCDTCRAIDEGRFIDLIEVDAASRTKVDDTREILDNVQFAPTQGRYKVYLIDEVHMLSRSSFNALLKTLEEPPEHVKFLLATTDPHKLPATVLSRCLQFNLMRLTQPQIQGHLANILEQEAIPFEQSALALIAKSADGSARDALSLLDQAIAYGAGEIRFEQVQTMLGLVDQQYTVAILQALAEESPQQIKDLIQQLAAMGVDYPALLAQLIETLHALAYSQVLGGTTDSSLLPEEVIADLSQQLSADRVQLLYQIALLSKQDMQLAPDIRIGFEMALLRMLAFQPEGSVISQESSTDSSTTASSTGRASVVQSPAPSQPQIAQQSVAPSAEGVGDSMLNDQDPQVVLSALSSARALVSKNKTVAREPSPSQHQFEPQEQVHEQAQVHTPIQAPQQVNNVPQSGAVDQGHTQGWQPNYNEPLQQGYNQSVMDDAPPWDLDGSNPMPDYGQGSMQGSVQNPQMGQSQPSQQPSQQTQPQPRPQRTEQSTAIANDHLSQIKERLKQPLGKPQGVTTTNQPDMQTSNAHSQSESARFAEPAGMSNVAPNPVKSVRTIGPDSIRMPEQNSVRERMQQMANLPDVEQTEFNHHSSQQTPQSVATAALELGSSAQSATQLSAQNAEVEVPVEGVLEVEYVALTEQNRLTVWLELLGQLKPEGMPAELTRQSVLVAYSPEVWQLSVDPQQAYAKSDMAALRLTETIERRLGYAVALEFVEFDQHNTPAKHEQFLADEKQSQAEVSIENDAVASSFMSELGMELVANSVRPVSEQAG